MQIQINTGQHVDGSVALTAHVQGAVTKTLHHLEEHLTRVEVHLDGESRGKGGAVDNCCKMEARPRNHQPVAVSHKAETMHQAVDGASRKLKSSLEHLFGRLEDRQRRPDIIDEENQE